MMPSFDGIKDTILSKNNENQLKYKIIQLAILIDPNYGLCTSLRVCTF